MLFKVRLSLGAALIVSVFIQMNMAESGYAAGRPKIAFSSTRDGDSEIYVMDIDGGNHARLTINPARDYDPSWSPDGGRIAFVSNRNRGIEQIFVMDADGDNVTELTAEWTHQQPAWSPEGEKIAYVRNKGGRQVWVMDADGGNQRRLTQDGKNELPTWSPDGQRIAFVSTRDRRSLIYVMDENGENQESPTKDMVPVDAPSWSPDGQWIAYAANDERRIIQIYAVKVVGVPHIEKLTRDGHRKLQPTWSPDGNTIAYTSWEFNLKRDQKTIHLMTSEGKHLKQLSEDHQGNDADPDWFDPSAWSVSPAANVVTTWGEIKEPSSDR
ncbi:MAG: DPP IV N-terminal domain-containing protein [Candidatus Poribacteria bacterium]|nr:DPP IV N-terminal domain-containing protein [Candidatus Poribacteria bacterium]